MQVQGKPERWNMTEHDFLNLVKLRFVAANAAAFVFPNPTSLASSFAGGSDSNPSTKQSTIGSTVRPGSGFMHGETRLKIRQAPEHGPIPKDLRIA